MMSCPPTSPFSLFQLAAEGHAVSPGRTRRTRELGEWRIAEVLDVCAQPIVSTGIAAALFRNCLRFMGSGFADCYRLVVGSFPPVTATSRASSSSLQTVRQLRAVPPTPSTFSIRENNLERPTPSGA